MNTSKEFFDRLNTDEAFVTKVNEELTTRLGENASPDEETTYALISEIANDYGYEVKASEIADKRHIAMDELSEEELGKIAGGTIPIPLIVTSILSIITATSVSGTLVSVLATELSEAE